MTFTRVCFDEIGSTNDEAIRAVRNAEFSGQATFIAKTQSAARGTRGRSWQSKSGNLHATLVFPLNTDQKDASLFVYPISLCVRSVVSHYVQGYSVNIKWPNDVLIEGKKVSGCLHELISTKDGQYFIAGIGINLVWKPDSNVLYPTGCISEFCNEPPTALQVIDLLEQEFEQRVVSWNPAEFAACRDEYLLHSAQLGAGVTITFDRERNQSYSGVFSGISLDGRAQIHGADGLREFVAGDIFPDLK